MQVVIALNELLTIFFLQKHSLNLAMFGYREEDAGWTAEHALGHDGRICWEHLEFRRGRRRETGRRGTVAVKRRTVVWHAEDRRQDEVATRRHHSVYP